MTSFLPLTALLLAPLAAPAPNVERYNVVWHTPSVDASGVMPLGNGDIAAGVYALADGDLYLLLSKNDAFDAHGDILKTGRVRLTLDPNPFVAGRPFRQTLDLATGAVVIEADGVRVRVWADALRPVYHVEIDAPRDLTVTARPDLWRRSGPVQDVQLARDGRLLWYYAVGDQSVYAADLKHYGVEAAADRLPDPYRHNTFGGLLESAELTPSAAAPRDAALRGTGRRFDVRIHSLALQTPQPATWVETLVQQAARPVDTARDWERHCAWWAKFWERGWITASDRTVPAEAREQLDGEPGEGGLRAEADGAALVAQSYNVFRYLMACQSRGRVQTKFNGGLFTQPLRDKGKLTGEDDRLWGRRFTFQNQRLLYWPLLASGDFDLMRPFFEHYHRVLPIREAITQAWFGHGGAYFRENIEPTGAEIDDANHPHTPRNKPPKTRPGEAYDGWYHDYYFTSGLETVALMLDYASFTGDADFRERVLVPFARQVLRFFDLHYPRDAGGRLRLEPAQVLETWWVAVNPAPDVAGLRFCLDELLAARLGTADDQANWRRLRAELPPIALQTLDGQPAIAPAEKWDRKRNAENGELYPVFPFRCFGLALGTGELVAHTLKHRACVDAFGCACWTQDQIHWACAGRAAEAADGLVRRFRTASTMCRFPLYGRQGPDSCPDFDHFGAGAVALQRMLVQEAGDRILLLPAWPADWDTDFKLHLARGAVLTGTVKDGRLVAWEIQPATRRGDVVVGTPQPGRPPGAVIPVNAHPLRVGADQAGANQFRGQLGRLSLLRGQLTPAAVRALAVGDRTQALSGPQVLGSWLAPKAGDTLPTQPTDFDGLVTLEAWLCPADKEVGRIFDKLTPGVQDGFLFDTFPGLSLRLIVGPQQRVAKDVLKPGVWQHVAAVLDRGVSRLYLDGRLVP